MAQGQYKMIVCTLLLIVKDDRILLAMKKRGFGAGRWNGAGGKVGLDETIEQALVRECHEEIGVTPKSFTKVALHDFIFPDRKKNIRAHVYICSEWDGDPTESDEMAPKWFKISDIPYDDMWQDDRYWLPDVLAGKQLHCRFTFDEDDQVLESKMHEAALSDIW